MRTRLALGAAGIALGLFGVFRLLTQISSTNLVELGIWLVAALIIHDGVLSPLIVAVSWVLARVVPPRARRVLQPALLIGALVTVIALPLIYRQGSQPPSKGVLRQNYSGNLALVLAVVATLALLAYLAQVVRGMRTSR